MDEKKAEEVKEGMVKCNVVEARRTPKDEEVRSEDELTKQAEELFKKE